MTQNNNQAKAAINLRKVKGKEEWALVLETSHYQDKDIYGQQHDVEYLGLTITTVVFDKSSPIRVSKRGTETYPPIRDSRGVIICTSIEDQKKCNKAESLRKKKQKELDTQAFYTPAEKRLYDKLKHGNEDFIVYFADAIYRLHPNSSNNTLNNWRLCLGYLKEFNHNRPLCFKDLDMQLCNEFKSFVLSRPARRPGFTGVISQGAAATFYSIFKAALKQAFIEDYISINLGELAKGITAPRSKRETLDKEELIKLSKTPCCNNWVKRAALFTALTGLRHSDVRRITWEQLKETSTGWRLDFVQKKTGMPEYLPISEQALALCGERRSPQEYIFKGLPEINNANKIIHKWVAQAGIERRITYHCFRHTFATLLLQQGTDVLTIKSMMGHTRVTTTEIYTHIVDDAKTKAADTIKIKNIKWHKK